ncbi:unnamed protein product [Durusdinium trenchii]|uniref:Uncharacterized protein n=1 Tax=Durusdinium trenchii TaxID=1381693 RepID=A0ABP0PY26_9DINO
MKLAHGLCGTILAALWLALVISYVAAPCKLIEEHMYTMALFACQSLDSFPTELPTLTLVFFLVLCLVLVPGTVVQVSAVRWNVMLHSVGVATLAACILKVCLLYGESRSLLKDSLVFTGIVTGRAAAMYLGMLLLAISRRSIISDRWNLDYPNMIAFHRPVGWWVLWMSLLHSLAFGFYYLCRGGWRELLEACLPVAVRCDGSDHCWNTLGLVNGFGVVATAATIILAVSSQKVIRRRFYNLFYFTHLVTSFVFMLFCGLHDFAMVILMFPGLVFYVRDRFSGLVSLRGSTEVTINILCRSETSSLVMFSWYPAEGNRGSHLLPGTRWVYCRQKTISGLEWHPYSTIFHGNRAFILLKAAGDWSTSLCNSATRDTLRLDIEGPYGKSSDSSGRLGSGDQVRTLLIAGVRRVRLVTPTGLATMEIFDLTKDDSPEELMAEDDDESALQVMAIRKCDEIPDEVEEIFYDCQSGDESTSLRTPSMEDTGSDALRAQSKDVEGQIQNLCMVRNEAPNVVMTLDSGADVSVAPEQYYALGLPGHQRSTCMMDAQGGAIKSAGNRRLRLQAYTRAGEMVEFVEQFALGVGVTHPLMSFGRLLKQGWVLSRDSQGLYVEHKEKDLKIPARLERNSLVMDVRVCAVRAEDNETQEMEAMASNDKDIQESAPTVTAEAHSMERGVKRSVEEQEKEKMNEEEDQQMLALMQELSKQGSQRSPGYTTEESGDVIVEASSSEDGKVQACMARWQNWKLRKGMVKDGPMELSDSPVVDVMEDNHVFPVRGEATSLYGFISRELALLEKMPGWHALPNGIVVHSSPQATHFLDPSLSFGPEWCGRMTLLKKKDNSGAREQVESLANYVDTPLPYRPLPGGPRAALTFVAPGLIRDYFVVSSEVPVSQYPLLSGEPSSWPDDERDEEGGELPMLAAGSGGRPEILEDAAFIDPNELRIQIDETWFDKETKLKDLQEICKQLGLATSGSKIKVLRRLQSYKHHQEEKMAYEIAQRLFSESRREAIPLKAPKLPSRHEQELHQLTHLPFQSWCQQCVATRSREDPRRKEDQADRKDRGRPVISFDYGFTYTTGVPKDRQWGTALYVAESESKATMCIPVQAKGSLPWQYSVQGILMKTKFAARQRLAEAAEDAVGDEQVEKEAKLIGEQVAVGMYGHGPIAGPNTPGVPPDGYPKTPGKTPIAPTPAPKTTAARTPTIVPVPATPAAAAAPKTARPAPSGDKSDRPLVPRELPRIPLASEEDESPKRKVVRLPIPEAMRGEPARNFPPGPHEVETSPKRRIHEMVAEEVLQQQLNDVSDDEDIDRSKGKPPEVDEEELKKLDAEVELETEENEGTDTWWVRLLITMICLASVGALSLARMTLQTVQTWCSRRRGHQQPVQRQGEDEEEDDADGPHVRRGLQEDTSQHEEPHYENDPEKVNMQWQIVHLEVAVAEQEERLKEAREERDRQAREVVRMYNMCSELRFELEAVKEERDKTQKKAIRIAGTDDEDVVRAWEVVEAAIDFQFLRQRAEICVFITSQPLSDDVPTLETKIGSGFGGEEAWLKA